MPRKPARKWTIEPGRQKARVMISLDVATLETLEAVQAAHPEAESLSAAIRYLARQWSQDRQGKNPKKSPQPR